MALIAKALGTTTTANQKLLVLNLNGNQITDEGIASLCQVKKQICKNFNLSVSISCLFFSHKFMSYDLLQGLRTNRTLLSLSLGHNKIGDPGAKKLAEVSFSKGSLESCVFKTL